MCVKNVTRLGTYLKWDVFARILHYTMDFARNIANVWLYNLARIFVLLLLKFLIVKKNNTFIQTSIG